MVVRFSFFPMCRYSAGVVFSLFFTLGLWAKAQSMDSLFLHAPQKVLPLLRKNARLDLLDYYHSGMEAKVQNDLEGKSSLLRLTKRNCCVQLSEKVSLQLRLLRGKEGSLLSVVRNTKVGGAAGHIDFYTLNWQPLQVEMPSLVFASFLQEEGMTEERKKDLLTKISALPYFLEWEEEEEILWITLSLEGLTEEMKETLSPHLRPIAWHWSKGGWTEE